MYIYMGKPKLCRMKRLDVSPQKKFFFLLKRINLCTLPFSFHYLLYSQSMTIVLLYLILQIILRMILCANTHITKFLINCFGGIFRIIARKLANLQLFSILTSFLLEFREITLKSIFSLFNMCGIKFAECLLNIISYPSKLGYNKILTSNYFRRVVETDVNSFADFANKSGTCLIRPSTNSYHIVPLLIQILFYLLRNMMGNVYSYFGHYRNCHRVNMFGRRRSCGIHF